MEMSENVWIKANFQSMRDIITWIFVFIVVSIEAAVDQPHESLTGYSSCIVNGIVYKHGERIFRDNPCHVCLCLKGEVSCAWQDCPLPPEGCFEMTFTDMCNPSLYICPIPDSLGPESGKYDNTSEEKELESFVAVENSAACTIDGIPYETGDVVGTASHHCLECRCGRQDLYCSPRCCFRWSSFHDTPGQIMKALRIGSKVPALHPLHHLLRTHDEIPT